MKKGHLSTPCHYQFCLGVLGGMPATVENLLYLKNHIPAGSTWSAFGVGAGHLPILYATLALGGNVRVGMEDNVVYGKDKDGNKLTDFISIKVRGPLAERCAAFAWKGCKLAATGDFETITFADDPQRQPGFLIKASDVEFLSPRKAEDAAQAVDAASVCEDAA